MGIITEPQAPVLFRLMKALFQCTILFCIPGLFITLGVPTFTIELTRVDQERVDATVVKNVLFLVPISTHSATNLVDTESETIDGGVIRENNRSTGRITGEAEDSGLLLIKGINDKPIKVEISPKNLKDVEEEIQYFIAESEEPYLRLWVVSNWKFGVILPAGILLFCVIVFFMAAWSIITGKPLKSKGAAS